MSNENHVLDSTSREALDSDDPETWDCIIDHEDDIDWENIIATTEDDYKAGRYAFNSADYATDEEAMKAMSDLIDAIAERALKRVAADTSLDAQG